MATEEVWKPVVGFPNYEVSNTNRVRNIKYDRELKPSSINTVGLCKDGVCKSTNIKAIRMRAFLEEPYRG